ncbi:MAG: porphobilinogen synthase, partial [Yaniella sp.]|nr:porphobilinogen synthase [Yaniella sp.]
MFAHRPRRLRQSGPIRKLVAQNRLAPADLILPAFVKEGAKQPIDISSMPGVQQHSMYSLKAAAR